MPLLPVAGAAIADHHMGTVRFAMKDGSKPVAILVSNTALKTIDIAPIECDDYFTTFKLYRKTFERIASEKYDRGYIETDGTVCIRAIDVPFASAN